MNNYFHNYNFIERVFNSLFRYENVPDTIDIDFVNWNMNRMGYVTGLKANDGTLRTLQGAIHGVDVYNRPTDFESANPVNKYSGLRRKIGKNCVVIYNTLNRRIPQPNTSLFTKYATLLTNIDASIDCAVYNSRLAYIYNVESDTEAQKVRVMCDQVAKGKPAILTNRNTVSQIVNGTTAPLVEVLPVKNNYILDLLLRDRYTILCNFLSEIGINNTPFEKKERQIVDEVESNNELLDITNFEFLKARKDGWDAFNGMFGTEVKVVFNRKAVDNIMNSQEVFEDETVLSDV